MSRRNEVQNSLEDLYEYYISLGFNEKKAEELAKEDIFYE